MCSSDLKNELDAYNELMKKYNDLSAKAYAGGKFIPIHLYA